MEELIARARARDPEAFCDLMRRYKLPMYKVAKGILYSDEDVADAMQDAVLACWEEIDGLRNPSGFRAWLMKILVNKCRDIMRKKELLFLSDEMPEIETKDTELENLEWAEVLRGLDEKYRMVLILYYIEGFRASEISEILGIPASTVRTQLERGRKKLSGTV